MLAHLNWPEPVWSRHAALGTQDVPKLCIRYGFIRIYPGMGAVPPCNGEFVGDLEKDY